MTNIRSNFKYKDKLKYAKADALCPKSTKNTLLRSINPMAEVNLLRKSKNKTQTLSLLQSIKETKYKQCITMEIISTLIYFEDFAGALKRIESNPEKTFELRKIALFLKIHLKDWQCKNSRRSLDNDRNEEYEAVKNEMIELLKEQFDINLFLFFFSFIKDYCVCYEKLCHLRYNFDFVDENYMKKMTYKELVCLSRVVDNNKMRVEKFLAHPFLCTSANLSGLFYKQGEWDAVRFLMERRWMSKNNGVDSKDLMNKAIEIKQRDHRKKSFKIMKKIFKLFEFKKISKHERLDIKLNED